MSTVHLRYSTVQRILNSTFYRCNIDFLYTFTLYRNILSKFSMKTIKIIRTIKIWDDNGMCSAPFVFPWMTFKMKFYTIGVCLPPLTPVFGGE